MSHQLSRQRSVEGLFVGDNLRIMNKFPSESFDMIYADPPFFSNRDYGLGSEKKFQDKWSSINEYLEWIFPRLQQCHRVLRTTGSMYLHCDPHASHYLKMLLDRIFGYENFINEIIWKRQSAHNDYLQGAKHFGRIHDTILFYSKTSSYTWNPQFVPYESSYIKKFYRYIERETERRYAVGDLTGPGGALKGNPYFEFLGVKRYWRYSKEKLERLLKENRIHWKPGNVPLLKRYLDEMNGRPIQDIWTDQPIERVRQYPTQKPEKLVSRLVLASTLKGERVLDPFCGSGTAIIAANRLERRWCGIDISSEAIDLAQQRLSS